MREIGDVYNSNVLSEVDNVSQLASSWAIKQAEEELLYYRHISDNWPLTAKLTLPIVSLCARKVELAKRADRRLDDHGRMMLVCSVMSVCLSVTRS